MLKIADFLLFKSSYSWELTFGLAAAALLFGYFFKSALIYKQRKRILHLEDEMLANHSRILSLEKKIAELKETPIVSHTDFELIRGKERDSKIS